MSDALKFRYVGSRDASGLPFLYLSHPLYGGIPARDLNESDVAGLHEEQRAMLSESPLYQKVSRDEGRREAAPESDGNVSSPGLPEMQREPNTIPGTAAAGFSGETPAGPPTDAEAQMEVERQSAASNPAVADNPPVKMPRRSSERKG